MRRTGCVCTALALMLGAARAQKVDVKSDLDKLQGSWAMVLFFANGEELPADLVKTGEVLIDDNEYRPKLGATVETATVRLDSSKSPKQIDITYTTGFLKGNTTRGIYKLDGDTWTICRGMSADKGRPTEFAAPTGSGFQLVVWKRANTAAGEKLKAVQSELKRFEATWRFVSIEIEGMVLPEEAFKDDTLTLKGKQFSSTVRGKTNTGAFKIDPTMTPKTIDITMTDGSGKSVTQKGIYELDGDNQKICISAPGKPRPTEFVAMPDSGRIIEVLKRAKP